MARVDKDGNLILEITLDCSVKYSTAEEMYMSVLAAAEAVFVDALGDPEIQDRMEAVLAHKAAEAEEDSFTPSNN